MTAAGATPPKYNPELVKCAVLEVIIELHPQHLTVRELTLRIIADPEDTLEVEIATQAIRELRGCGLVCGRPDDLIVEPTIAALHAHALMTR